MLTEETYGATAIGSVGTMTFVGMVSIGAPSDESGYQRFAEEVAVLESMEAQGLVQIIFRHQENMSGHNYVDVVRFTRLA